MKTNVLSHSKKFYLVGLILFTTLFLPFAAANLEGNPETAGGFVGGADISSVSINLTSFTKGYVASIGILRGGGFGPSNFSVYINQSGTSIANGTILNVVTSPIFFVNFTQDNYSSFIQPGNFTIEIHRDNGDILFQRGINHNFSGEHFNFTLATVPATVEDMLVYVPFANYSQYQTYFPTISLVGEEVNYGVTLNVTNGLSIISSNFIYDGTVYAVSIDDLGSDTYNITKTLQTPSGSGDKTYYFNFTLSNGESGSSTEENLTVSSLGIDGCGVYAENLYTFTLKDEITLTTLDGNADVTNSSINIELYDAAGLTLVANYSTDFDLTNPFSICLENALTGVSEYIINLQVQYDAKEHTKEFYNIYGATLTDDDMATAISLYPLDNESSQVFKISYKDTSFLPVENAVIQIQRKYVGDGVSRTVEQPKTDSNGEAIGHLELDDVIYTFTVLVNGKVDAIFTDIIPYCPNPFLTDCEINLNALQSNTDLTDFSSIGDLDFTLDWDKDTRTVSTDFSVRSQTAKKISLNVTLFDSLGNTSVCNPQVTASAGSLNCVVPDSFGNSTIIASVYLDNEYIGRSIISMAPDPSDYYGLSLVFMALIIILGLTAIGLTGNPFISGFFLIVTLMILSALNIIYTTGWIGAGATILWFIIAVIIVMIKGVNR